MGGSKPGQRTRALGTRDRVMSCLAADGDITDPTGMASTALAAAIGYPGSSAAFAQLLSGMERSGLIEREIRGKRTYRIAAAGSASQGRPERPMARRRPAKPGQVAAAGMTAVRGRQQAGADDGSSQDLVAAAREAAGFDYDELARRLLVQIVRRLAISPGDGAGPGPTAEPAGPGLAGPGLAGPGPGDAALQQTMAGLEQKLASARSGQRRLTEENAQLREQLQAAQQSLAQAQERASAGRITSELGSAEFRMLERLLSSHRDQGDREEEAGAG